MDSQSTRRRLIDFVVAFARDRRAATAVYAGVTVATLFGVGMLSVDVGRMVVLRNELQNAADSACLAAAAELDGRTGAQQRATEVAQQTALDESNLVVGDPNLTVAGLQFYRFWNHPDEGTVVANGDGDTGFVRVDLNVQNINFMLQPVFDALFAKSGTTAMALNTHAVCEYASIDCNMVPMLICTDKNDPANNLLDPQNLGKQTIAKEGPGSMMPDTAGAFGLLCVSQGGSYSCGAKDIGEGLASGQGTLCDADYVQTGPGSKTNQTNWGINNRLGDNKYPNFSPAPNVANYPRHQIYLPGGPGSTAPVAPDYEWDAKGYWNSAHQMKYQNKPVYEYDALNNVCDTTKPVGDPHYLNDDDLALGDYPVLLCTLKPDGSPDPIPGGNGTLTVMGTLANAANLGPGDGFINKSTILQTVHNIPGGDPLAPQLSPIAGADSFTDIPANLYDPKSGNSIPDTILTRYKVYLFEAYYFSAQNSPATVTECPGRDPYNMPDPAKYQECGNPNKYRHMDNPTNWPAGHEPRIIRVGVVDCVNEVNLQGQTQVPTSLLSYIDVFVTEKAPDPPDASVYGEIVRQVPRAGEGGLGPEVLNVRLVD